MKTTPSVRFHLHLHCPSFFRMLVWIGMLGIVGCGFFAAGPADRSVSPPAPSASLTARELSPAEDYAGEILAYFLQIVVGRIGPEERRLAWRSTGSDVDLDFQAISRIMNRPASRKSDLLVLDFNLLSLVEVLSHYNPRFNLFKGRAIFDSVYPSSELIAVRLLIQRKLNRGEKVSFTALHKHEALLRSQADGPSPSDLAEMNLSAAEFQLLKDVFTSDPLFLQYYKHPFIVEAMARIGFYRNDRLTEEISRKASYRRYVFRRRDRRRTHPSVHVVILPSLTREFEFGGAYETPYVYGFKPSGKFEQATAKLKADILARSARLLLSELKNSGEEAAGSLPWKQLWDRTYAPLIRFTLFDQRPLTIYPENADRLLEGIYPTADVIILMLGEGIDRIIDSRKNAGDFPATGRLYFSMDDIRYYRNNEKIDQVARGIVDRLMSIRVSAEDPGAGG